MSRHAMIAVLIVLVLAAPTSAWAQRVRRPPPESRKPKAEASPRPTEAAARPKAEDAKAEASEKDGEEKPFSPFGDTSRFTRLGGWGGIGGAMGQMGFGTSMLMMAPAVQEELELTDEQKKQLADWAIAMRDHGREMGEALRAEGEAAMREMDLGAAMRLMGQLNGLMQENEKGIERILTRKQWTRLRQISLQMQGISAVTRPDVAAALVLAPEQLEQIHEILAQAQLRQVGFWMQQGMAMRRRAESARDRGAGRERGQPAAAEAESKDEDDRRVDARDAEDASRGEDDDARRARRRREFRKEFDTMREGADRLHQETVEALLRVLTRRQRATFEKLLGPPFDPEALTRGWNPRREGDPGDTAPRASRDDGN